MLVGAVAIVACLSLHSGSPETMLSLIAVLGLSL